MGGREGWGGSVLFFFYSYFHFFLPEHLEEKGKIKSEELAPRKRTWTRLWGPGGLCRSFLFPPFLFSLFLNIWKKWVGEI